MQEDLVKFKMPNYVRQIRERAQLREKEKERQRKERFALEVISFLKREGYIVDKAEIGDELSLSVISKKGRSVFSYPLKDEFTDDDKIEIRSCVEEGLIREEKKPPVLFIDLSKTKFVDDGSDSLKIYHPMLSVGEDDYIGEVSKDLVGKPELVDILKETVLDYIKDWPVEVSLKIEFEKPEILKKSTSKKSSRVPEWIQELISPKKQEQETVTRKSSQETSKNVKKEGSGAISPQLYQYHPVIRVNKAFLVGLEIGDYVTIDGRKYVVESDSENQLSKGRGDASYFVLRLVDEGGAKK